MGSPWLLALGVVGLVFGFGSIIHGFRHGHRMPIVQGAGFVAVGTVGVVCGVAFTLGFFLSNESSKER